MSKIGAVSGADTSEKSEERQSPGRKAHLTVSGVDESMFNYREKAEQDGCPTGCPLFLRLIVTDILYVDHSLVSSFFSARPETMSLEKRSRAA